jgi:DNA (cytosine-5)-methyltransferase 1
VLRDLPFIVDADVLVGGTPCQAFSVAGLRNSLADERGNLSLEFVRLADAIDDVRRAANKPEAIIVWENVPGVLSVKDNAFGCFLAALAGEDDPLVPPRGKWTNAGVVDGPKRKIAWRVLDAQYFGLAQRRRRVFVVASSRDGFDPAEVLFELEGVQRHSAPSREAGQAASAGTASRAGERSSHWDGDFPHPTLNQSAKVSGGVGSSNQELFSQRGAYLAPAHPVVMAHGQANAEIRTDGGTPALTCIHEAPIAAYAVMEDPVPPLMARSSRGGAQTLSPGHQTDGHMVAVTHSLRGDMGDVVNALNAQSGETGKGDAAPCVALFKGDQQDAYAKETGPIEALRALRREIGEEAFTVWGFGILASLQSPEVLRSALHGCGLRPAAFSRSWVVCCTLGGAKHGPGWLMQSLRETGCAGCPPQGWEPPEQLARELGAYLSELSQPGPQAERFMRDLWLTAEGTGVLREALSAVQAMGRSAGREGQPTHAGMAVRRLTATECEFLQGFPRGYTMIPWKKKPAEDCPDGPRYKAIGNSMAVPCMRWIGERIQRHLRGET